MDPILKPRSSFWLTKFFSNFGEVKNAWTTIGNIIYYPDNIKNPYDFPAVIEHEKQHIEQYNKLGVPLFLFLYALIPLPIGFSYFRWKFERQGYLSEIKYYIEHRKNVNVDLLIEQAVESLWGFYAFPWPKNLMRNWFKKELKNNK